jgi:hypothetical protein
MIDKTEMYEAVFIGTIFSNGYCKGSTDMEHRLFMSLRYGKKPFRQEDPGFISIESFIFIHSAILKVILVR